MPLPKSIRERLAEEYRLAARQMQEAPTPLRKLYYFSVFYGEANRALNWSWDADLALLHMVLKGAYEEINARAKAVATGADPVVGLPDIILATLTETAAEIAALLEHPHIDRMALYRLLAQVAEIAYATTGNGHYLWMKGVIKIGGDGPEDAGAPSEPGVLGREPRRRIILPRS